MFCLRGQTEDFYEKFEVGAQPFGGDQGHALPLRKTPTYSYWMCHKTETTTHEHIKASAAMET